MSKSSKMISTGPRGRPMALSVAAFAAAPAQAADGGAICGRRDSVAWRLVRWQAGAANAGAAPARRRIMRRPIIRRRPRRAAGAKPRQVWGRLRLCRTPGPGFCE